MGLADNIRETYAQAAKEVKKKLDEYTKHYQAQIAVMQKRLESGKISQEDYNDWLERQIFRGKRWQEKLDDITKTYVDADGTARELVGDRSKNVFARFANSTARDIQNRFNGGVSFDMYDRHAVERLLKENPQMLPEWKINEKKDYRWNAQRVQNAITQGIIQGESIPQLAKRLTSELSAGSAKHMTLFARTAMTGAQNAGRIERLHEAQDMGIVVKKKWLAAHDDRVRDAHAELDGQTVDVDEPFHSSLGDIMYPGDPTADPANVYNCRCTLTYVYDVKASRENLQEKEQQRVEETQVTTSVVQGQDITGTWQRRPEQFDFEIEDVISAQGFDGKPRVVDADEFDRLAKQANGGKGFVAQRTYSAPDQETLDVYRQQLYDGQWYIDCTHRSAAYGQGMYATGDFSGQMTEEMKRASEFYRNLGEQAGNTVSYIEEFTLQPDARIVDYDDLYSEFNAYRMEVQRENAEIRQTAIQDASRQLADELLKSAGFEEEYARKFFYGNLSLGEVDWDEMGEAYAKLGKEGTRRMQELQSEYYRRQNDYMEAYIRRKSKDEIEDIGAYAASRGYDGIKVRNRGVYGTTEVVILNRTKVIFKRN